MEIKQSGCKEAAAMLRGMARAVITEPVRVAYQTSEAIMTRAKQLVPVEWGTLRASGFVEIADGQIVLGFGGAAEQYAAVQHEDLTLNHPNGGQAKFLEQPFVEMTQDLPQRMMDAVLEKAK